jgi:hypothetical protein
MAVGVHKRFVPMVFDYHVDGMPEAEFRDAMFLCFFIGGVGVRDAGCMLIAEDSMVATVCMVSHTAARAESSV